MNLQAISDFLDVVQNPEKYQRILDTLKTEQSKLQELLSTVDDVSKINEVKEQTQVLLKEAQQTLEDAKNTSTDIIAKAGDTYKKRLDAVIKRENEVQTQLQKILELSEETQKVQNTFNDQSKELTRREKVVLEREQKAVLTEQELNDRLDKLRSVMGG